MDVLKISRLGRKEIEDEVKRFIVAFRVRFEIIVMLLFNRLFNVADRATVCVNVSVDSVSTLTLDL
jgi:hypothetical protein